MNSILWIIIFVLALAVLLQSAKTFVELCGKLVKSLGWSSFLVGTTVLAIGTSLPELASSLWATSSDHTTLVASNVVGSNIANILLILGLGAMMVKRIELSKDTLHSQIGILLGSSFLLMVSLYDGTFHWYEGLMLMIVFALYTHYNAKEHQEGRLSQLKNWLTREKMSVQNTLMLLLSAVALSGSSYFVVKALEEMSSKMHLMPSLLGASILALGTSLPELVTTIVALKKGDRDMAMGNLIGSNVFNATIVMGLPSFIKPLTVSNDMIVLGIPFLLMATLLFVFALTERKLYSYEGAIYLILYGVFSFQLFTSF